MRARAIGCAWAAGLLLAAGAAQAQGPAAQPDRLKDAVDRIKVIGLGHSQVALDRQTTEIDNARRDLMGRKDEALPYVLPLLDENDTTLRVNGALMLAGLARAGVNKPELLAGLTRCLNDSNPGIKRWGLDGFLRPWPAEAAEPDVITLNDRVSSVRECLDLSKPRALRMSALMLLDERRPKFAIPLLVAHLQALLPEYLTQVEQMLTVEETPAAGGVPRPGTALPSRPEAPAHTRRVLDPAAMTDTEQAALIARVQRSPAVAELHFCGLVLEEIIKKEYRERFSETDAHFDNQAPWNLRACVEWVVNGWMPKHAEEFKDIPPAPAAKPPAAAPKAPAATPPAAAPAKPAAATTTTAKPAGK